MKPKARKTTKLSLHQETVRQLSDKTLDGVAGAAVNFGGPKPLEFSGGPQCTAGIACTFAMGCSGGCR